MATNVRKTYRRLELEKRRTFDLGLPELNTTEVHQAPHFQPYFEIECYPKCHNKECPCDKKATNITCIGQSYVRKVMDACVHTFERHGKSYLVDLKIHVPKYRCDACDGYPTFNHSFGCIQPGYTITERLFHQVGRDTFFFSYNDLAERYGISKGMIQRIKVDTEKNLRKQSPPCQAPQHLAIIDISISSQKGFSVFVDAETGKSVGSSRGNSRKDIATAIQGMPGYQDISKIYVSMNNSYQETIQKFLPGAKHIVDQYSAYQKLEMCYQTQIANIKNAFVNNTKGFVDQDLIREAYTLLSRLHPISRCFPPHEREKTFDASVRNNIMSVFPDIAFLLKFERAFHEIYLSHTSEEAYEKYIEWRKLLPPSGNRRIEDWEDEHKVARNLYQPLATFGQLTKKWETEILNYFEDLCEDSHHIIMHTDFAVSYLSLHNKLSFSSCSTVHAYWDFYSVLKNPITFEIYGQTPDGREFLPYEEYWKYCKAKGFSQYHDFPIGYKIFDTTRYEEPKPICVLDYNFPEQYSSLSSNGILL